MGTRLMRIVRRVGAAIAWVVAAFVVFTVGQVCVVRFVTPPATATMVGQAIERRDWVDVRATPLAELGSAGPRAFVASEDGRFFLHHGVDWQSTCQAVRDAVRGGRLRGGSTITQQTAKNLFLWQGRSFVRKGLELWYALWLDLLLPKERILELYLTVAETGPGVFGLEAGAQHHFGTHASALTWDQAGRIAGILPSPRTRAVDGQAATERTRWVRKNQVPFPGDPGWDQRVKQWEASDGLGRCWR